MRPAGLAQIEMAKSDGRWDVAYAPARTAEAPPDLVAALDANPKAAAFFATLTGANRFAILYRIGDGGDAGRAPARSPSSSPCWRRGENIHG